MGRGGNGPSGSGSFAVALGQFLDAWHAIPGASLPDAVSFHAYPSRTNVSYPPFPESNVSLNDPKCAAGSVPNVSCEHAVAHQPARLRDVLAARTWLQANIPIWNTESGWNTNKTLFHGADAEGHADEETGILRQAYLARLEILLANEGVAVNIWYEADHQCTGTLVGFALPSTSPNSARAPTTRRFLRDSTPAGRALKTMYEWLHGGNICGAVQIVGRCLVVPGERARSGTRRDRVDDQMEGRESASKLPGKYQFVHTLDGETMPFKPNEKTLSSGRGCSMTGNEDSFQLLSFSFVARIAAAAAAWP